MGNTKLQPYTEHNENQPIIFNIFLDDRTVNSEHFQSLKQPEAKTSEENQEQKTEQKYGKTNRTSEEVRESYMSQFQNKKSKTVQDTVSNNKNQMNTQQIDGTTKVNSENAQNTKVN